ncbi:hypothetical protein JTE90_003199 [Oedothorax gibbosus]|uniref:Uncharacterized protein n=1 Tax=Oedothorax gibbosus TaxID=931172 RepID=A0AAV6TJ73_9ARAC|nr:hypothetical protein JTE90_003199 [Oedothorax gibbosus]
MHVFEKSMALRRMAENETKFDILSSCIIITVLGRHLNHKAKGLSPSKEEYQVVSPVMQSKAIFFKNLHLNTSKGMSPSKRSTRSFSSDAVKPFNLEGRGLSPPARTGRGLYLRRPRTGRGLYLRRPRTGRGLYLRRPRTGRGLYLRRPRTGRGLYLRRPRTEEGFSPPAPNRKRALVSAGPEQEEGFVSAGPEQEEGFFSAGPEQEEGFISAGPEQEERGLYLRK